MGVPELAGEGRQTVGRGTHETNEAHRQVVVTIYKQEQEALQSF